LPSFSLGGRHGLLGDHHHLVRADPLADSRKPRPKRFLQLPEVHPAIVTRLLVQGDLRPRSWVISSLVPLSDLSDVVRCFIEAWARLPLSIFTSFFALIEAVAT
jgi:hypothetical protein